MLMGEPGCGGRERKALALDQKAANDCEVCNPRPDGSLICGDFTVVEQQEKLVAWTFSSARLEWRDYFENVLWMSSGWEFPPQCQILNVVSISCMVQGTHKIATFLHAD